jgi:Hemerythrin HHE cation binding domain
MTSSDAFELLTDQHEEIEELIARLGLTTDPGDRVELVREVADKVTAHLASEQEILYRVAGPLISDPVMYEMMIEHITIKRQIADLLWLETDDPRFESMIDTLTTLCNGHALWQEHELFVTVESAFDREQLADLAAKLRTSSVISLHIAFAQAA